MSAGELSETVFHGWHREAGAKMVDFGGWHMPLHYPGGIIQEHLAVRRHAGLFDISHMGRFRLTGPKAEPFLLQALTNNIRALKPGEAHYTFIATETGGAVDDAYVYRLGEEDFLLVVNAANRQKDWDWLDRLNRDGAAIEDVSEALAMVALQGPHAATMLEALTGAAALPESKRNQLGEASFAGAPLIVARTGYTGESICFELFVPRARALDLWTRLVAEGAVPAGLGARDSLRMEAGLPLYGHELGEDPDGREIPIFANSLASFAVRPAGMGGYVGADALERQRAEFSEIRRNELDAPVAERLLSRMVQPIAVFEGRRPLRAGYQVLHEGEHVGHVTSGSVVPYARFYGEGVTAVPTEEHDLRPIGLALIDSDLRYRVDRPVVLEIDDGRGHRWPAELVERNLYPLPPYGRPYTGFTAPVTPPRLDPDNLEHLAAGLDEAARANTRWRREECINLIPSEQTPSPFVERLVIADPAGRYNEHNQVKALGPDSPDVRYYKGTAFIMEKEEELKAALRAFFDCSRVEPRVISGQMANDTVYDALLQFKNRHRSGGQPVRLSRVLVHDLKKGGHLSAQTLGALRNYVAHDPETGRPAVETFPHQPDYPHKIDAEATKALIERTRPELIVFGRSVIIHQEPVAEIRAFIDELFGADNPARPVIHYDGAHVLGLLGPAFQAPLAEGADFITGSTHKTFFGPQRGVILSDIQPDSAFEPLWRQIESRAFPGHVSNHHLGTLLGMLGATYEMLRYREDYPFQVVKNAKAFAKALAGEGLSIEGDPALDHTETHQVLLRTARARGEPIATRLEAANVITNPQAYQDDPSFAAASGVRMGTQEMTRYGMKEADFAELAALLAKIIADDAEDAGARWAKTVTDLRAGFRTMHYFLA